MTDNQPGWRQGYVGHETRPRPSAPENWKSEAQWEDMRPYSGFKRFMYGMWWTFVTTLLVIATLMQAASGAPGQVLVGGALAFLAGRYAYRLWTWQAKHLVFLIVI